MEMIVINWFPKKLKWYTFSPAVFEDPHFFLPAHQSTQLLKALLFFQSNSSKLLPILTIICIPLTSREVEEPNWKSVTSDNCRAPHACKEHSRLAFPEPKKSYMDLDISFSIIQRKRLTHNQIVLWVCLIFVICWYLCVEGVCPLNKNLEMCPLVENTFLMPH